MLRAGRRGLNPAFQTDPPIKPRGICKAPEAFIAWSPAPGLGSVCSGPGLIHTPISTDFRQRSHEHSGLTAQWPVPGGLPRERWGPLVLGVTDAQPGV